MEGSLVCSGKTARYQYKRRHTVCATFEVRKRGDVCKKPHWKDKPEIVKNGEVKEEERECIWGNRDKTGYWLGKYVSTL